MKARTTLPLLSPSWASKPMMPARHLTAFVVLAVCFVLPNSLLGQVRRSVPTEGYYYAKRDFYAGDYRAAERGFRQSLRSGPRVGTARWVDAICYYAMLGEVYFHRGQLKQALELHEQALQWHLQNGDWLARIRYPSIAATNKPIRAQIGWGNRSTIVGQFPDTMGSMEGTLNVEQSFQVGGAVNPAHMRSVDAVEVIRCLAISLKRRGELLGPTAPLSKLGAQVTSSLSDVAAPSGHYSSSWVEVLYGLALLAQGQSKSAMPHLRLGTVAGNYDHPLTGIALLEQGKFLLREEEYGAAIEYLNQASVAAAEFGQAEIIEEALRYLNDAFLANDLQGNYPAVQAVLVYANREDAFRLAAASLLGAAEVSVYGNDAVTANQWLKQARTIMARQDLLATDLGARLVYLEAIAQYRAGATKSANQSIKTALSYMQGASIRRFHLGLVESLYNAGRKAVSPRQMEILYARVLREPRDEDWRVEPLESITMLLASHTRSLERWFELLVDRKEYEKAVRVAEQLRRHRFYSSLPFGGRILSLRWLVEGQQTMLGKTGIAQQDRLRRKYPALTKLSREAERIQVKLRKLPLLPKEEDDQQTQRSLIKQLVSISRQQESIIREIALRREPAKLVFPPQPSLSAVQRAIRDDQAVLMFVTTAQGWHAWFVRRDADEYWAVRSPRKVKRAISGLLRAIGNRNADYEVPAADLSEESWKKVAAQIWADLIGELPSNSWDNLKELVIVPDGFLWYLPFETLQVPAAQLPEHDASQSLISLVRVRYAPTASLSVGDQRGHQPNLKTTVVGGQLFLKESSQYAGEMLAALKQAQPELEVISKRKPLASAGYLGGTLERVVVWNDVAARGPYQWSPAQFDRSMSHALLADWIEYPWGSPDQLILPGFHTAAEANLGSQDSGYEIFLAACGIMATGTRTALLSRWRTGGKTPAVLVREFTTQLSSAGASAAWQHAVSVARHEQLDAKLEPRVRAARDITEVSADHPFFWAGYLLLDTGAEPEESPPGVPEAAVDMPADEVPLDGGDQPLDGDEPPGEGAEASADEAFLQLEEILPNEEGAFGAEELGDG